VAVVRNAFQQNPDFGFGPAIFPAIFLTTHVLPGHIADRNLSIRYSFFKSFFYFGPFGLQFHLSVFI